jgi:hypothetical protein
MLGVVYLYLGPAVYYKVILSLQPIFGKITILISLTVTFLFLHLFITHSTKFSQLCIKYTYK